MISNNVDLKGISMQISCKENVPVQSHQKVPHAHKYTKAKLYVSINSKYKLEKFIFAQK